MLGVHASLVLREPWRHRQIGDGVPVTSDDICLVDEVFAISLSKLAELIAPVHRVEDAVVLIVALPDIEAEGYVAQVLCELEALDSGSQRADRCEVVGHEESEAEGAVAPLRYAREVDSVGVCIASEYGELVGTAEGSALRSVVPSALAVVRHAGDEVEGGAIGIAVSEGHEGVPLLLVDLRSPWPRLRGVAPATMEVDEERIATGRLSSLSEEAELHLFTLGDLPDESVGGVQ